MVAYDFATQLSKGEAAERLLDAHFATWFAITPASADEQRRGMDRWWTGRKTGQRFAVEYKTDYRAAQTGNVFIETVSVDGAKPGWAFTSQARWLIYFTPGFGGEQVYMVVLEDLRTKLREWRERWPEKTVQNQGYTSRGVIVPLREMERVAFQVVSL
jgi:hypothetical protein